MILFSGNPFSVLQQHACKSTHMFELEIYTAIKTRTMSACSSGMHAFHAQLNTMCVDTCLCTLGKSAPACACHL